jgi:uncharacterized protein YbaA (DUF1428 family)
MAKVMGKYVDGFVVPVQKKRLNEYRKMAKIFSKVCMEYGALEYLENIADDVKRGKYTSFPRSVKLKAGEVVFLSWVVYKNRAHRDRVNKKIMKDERLKEFMNVKNMPFDGKRMFWGGFKVFIRA